MIEQPRERQPIKQDEKYKGGKTSALKLSNSQRPKQIIKTELGKAYWANGLDVMSKLRSQSVDLIVTSPPFALTRKKEYGNADAQNYVQWFRPFAKEFSRLLKDSGSLVIDLGGAWNAGMPTKSLYQHRLLIDLCDHFEFHLAQEFFWWNPSKLPTPAEWVTVRRIRVKDSVNSVFWLSRTPWPKSGNRRVLEPYSDAMHKLIEKGYTPKLRPSGHDISTKFGNDNKGAIPSNLLTVANTESNSAYLRYCKINEVKPHPARFPAAIPEFFIRFLTDPGDLVLDPFAGSCASGEVAERLDRQWICTEIEETYLAGAKGRFKVSQSRTAKHQGSRHSEIGSLWSSLNGEALRQDGGRARAK